MQQQMENFWHKMTGEARERMEAMHTEWLSMEKKGVEQWGQAFDDMSRLTRSTMQYQTEMASHWRQLTLENMQRMFDARK